MQARYKWLLLPPAIAVVLIMGPLRQTEPPAPEPETVQAVEAENPVDQNPVDQSPVGQGLVPMPDAWQVASSLFGILLLGVAGVMLLARIRKGPSSRGAELMSLRQSLRLSGRHKLHAVQFEDSILVIGESEGRLVLLEKGSDPEQFADDEELAARDEDGGAVPRDMVIPRPPASARKRPVPPRAQSPERARRSLDEFKDLMRSVKAGAGR